MMTNTVIVEQKVTKIIEVVTAGPQGIAGDGLSALIDDATPALGGELDAGAHTIGFTQQTATGSGATAIDWKLGNKLKFTFGAFSETFSFTSPTKPCNLLLVLVQDATGSRAASWPASIKWVGGVAPTLTSTAGAVDICSFYWDGDNYHGAASLAFSIPV